jgi:hypothetical protein
MIKNLILGILLNTKNISYVIEGFVGSQTSYNFMFALETFTKIDSLCYNLFHCIEGNEIGFA